MVAGGAAKRILSLHVFRSQEEAGHHTVEGVLGGHATGDLGLFILVWYFSRRFLAGISCFLLLATFSYLVPAPNHLQGLKNVQESATYKRTAENLQFAKEIAKEKSAGLWAGISASATFQVGSSVLSY